MARYDGRHRSPLPTPPRFLLLLLLHFLLHLLIYSQQPAKVSNLHTEDQGDVGGEAEGGHPRARPGTATAALGGCHRGNVPRLRPVHGAEQGLEVRARGTRNNADYGRYCPRGVRQRCRRRVRQSLVFFFVFWFLLSSDGLW